MRQQLALSLQNGALQNSKINLQITVLPEAEFKTQGISLVPVPVNKQPTINKIEEQIKKEPESKTPEKRGSDIREADTLTSTQISSIDMSTEETKVEPPVEASKAEPV